MAAPPSQASPRWSILDHPGLFEALHAEAITGLQALLKRSLDKVDSWVFDCLSKAPTHAPLLDAVKVLRARRGEFERAYLNQMKLGFAALQGRILPEPSAEQELSLVDDEELEGMLASESMVAAVQAVHSVDLDVLSRRLAAMAGRRSLKDAHNPLSTAWLGSALQVAQRECPIPAALRAPLLKTYERELIATLGALLQSLSSRLAQAGILPNLDRPPDPVKEPEEQGPPLPPAQVYVPENAPGVDVRATFNALRGLLHRRRPPPADEPDLDGLALPDLRQALDDSQLVAVLSLMQPTVPALVLNALSDSGAALADLIKAAILQGVGKVGLTRDMAILSQDHEDAIDLVGMLFGVLFEEREFAERPRQLLAQLVVPYVKAAVMDLRMFQFTTHPARLLLNALAESLEGNRGEGVFERALQKQVESMVQRLLTGFRFSISVFPKLDKEFREYLIRHRQRQELAERRAAELQSGQERLENARARSEQELRARLDGRVLPEPLRDFLSRYWAHHLAMVLLREGGDSEGWRRSIAIADRLLALPAAGPVGIRKTLAELDTELHGGLQSSGVTGDAAKEVLARVVIALLSRFVTPKAASTASAAQTALPTVAPAPVPSVAPTATAAPTALPAVVPAPEPKVTPTGTAGAALTVAKPSAKGPPPAAQPPSKDAAIGTILDDDLELAAMRSLKLGDWIELVGEDRKIRPLKLSWVSPISYNMVFVNRHGVRILVASAQELVALRKKGQLLLHSHGQLFDHALHRIKERLEAELTTS